MIDLLVGAAMGILCGLGVGSGGWLILYLTEKGGMPQLAAQGLNLAIFVFALGAAILVHLHGRTLSPALLLLVVVPGAAGALCGSLLSACVPAQWLRRSLGGWMLIMGGTVLWQSRPHAGGKKRKERPVCREKRPPS